jgi:hypothetical protein
VSEVLMLTYLYLILSELELSVGSTVNSCQ